ncbi:glycosyl hydrolase [Coniochaeta ligniaria NRRL 30616]|uniref:Glycosyl hydrolase n=1 Tax=Coniochaeta ligniaria NRRL 30616 TaxID=1408157 RepID=A0A1J7JHD9_9PEZI|nr:glycosyl hydrolase [Coniochaeta ligniaria NRRL 30616]
MHGRLLRASFTLALALPIGAKVPSCVTDNDLAILAGAHVIYSWPQTVSPPDELVDLTRDGLVGGVILFGENVGNGTADALASLQSDYESSPAAAVFQRYFRTSGPLFITTDQEGGQVRRIKTGGPFLTAKQTGASPDPAAAGTTAGEEAAAALQGDNFNSNLAPVLDIFRQAKDFTDYFQRSYGNTSTIVSAAATAFIKAQQAAGIPATAKHFPGLGSATHQQDTDAGPVTLNLTLEEIRTVDEVPYTSAIAAGLDLVMPSWAVYPALDDVPSGLSVKWITEELRGRLGFTGVTITDALEAGALTPFGDLPTVSVSAAKAGMDMLLASQRNVTQGEVVRSALVAAVRSGDVEWKDFVASTKRILALRSRLYG